jgi:hypothetical protein
MTDAAIERDHAILSASGAPGWMRCYGKLAMEKGFPESSSKYADEGTAAHDVASMCLEQGQDAAAFVGRMIQVKDRDSWEVTEEMAEAVQVYVDLVRGLGGELMVEQKVDYTRYVLDEGHDPSMSAYGTSDALVVVGTELIVVDYKHGRGVKVDAEENEQLMLYALGCYDVASLAYEIETVRLMIVQPRASNISEWTLSVDELMQFGMKAKIAARHAAHQYEGNAEPKLTPGEKQCRFCKAKAVCPALQAEVQETVSFGAASSDDFEIIDPATFSSEAGREVEDERTRLLSQAMAKVDLIEGWCKAVRAEVERRLLEGKEVEGFKLVQGRKGARTWANPEEAELALKAMRLKQDVMYDLKLISPTTAEKLAKAGTIGTRQWPKVQALITQAEGGPSVAPVSDKRPAILVAVTPDDFSVVDDLGDLA